MTTPDFAAVRAEFALPDGFPPAVLAEAARAAASRPAGERVDATDVELVTIDPPGSKDLDQALGVTRRGDGFRVHYAIADLGAVVVPGGALDDEVRKRGQTIYLPDGSVPLHPPVLSEGASSLLPDGPRPAVLWTIDLDGAGERTAVEVHRATVRVAGPAGLRGRPGRRGRGPPAPGHHGPAGAGQAPPCAGRRTGGDRAGAPRAGGGARRVGRLDHPDPPAAGRRVVERGDLAAHRHGGGVDHVGGRGRGAADAPRAGAVGRGSAAAHGGDPRRRLAARGDGRAGAVRAPPRHRARTGAASGGQRAAARRGLRRVRPVSGHGGACRPRPRRDRRALRPRHRAAAAPGRPVRHRGVPGRHGREPPCRSG